MLITKDLILSFNALSNIERVIKSYRSTYDLLIAYRGLVDFVDVRELDAIFPTLYSVLGLYKRSNKPREGYKYR